MNTLHCKAFIALSTLVPALLGAPLALAVTFTVNSTLDERDDMETPGMCHTEAGTCTLRAAVMQANRISGIGATIVVPPGLYLLTISALEGDEEYNGDLNLTTPPSGQNPTITITGAGAGATIIDASQLDRVIHVHAGRTASISGVTIRNGYLSGPAVFGGGIFNEGSLTVSDAVITLNHAGSVGSCPATGGGIASTGSLTVVKSTISYNDAGCSGGGIYSEGALNVRDSTISHNGAQIAGGGIFDAGIGTLRTVQSSAIHDNTALAGGGILNGSVANNASSLILINSTLSQNRAVRGGGIYNFGIANVYNTSIVLNGADMNRDGSGTGGGVFNDDGVGRIFNLRNTLVTGNYLGNDHTTIADCAGTLIVYGPNLFGKLQPCTIHRDPGGSYDVTNSLSFIGPLQDNGGPTLTHALLSGSNAIDAGDPIQGCVDDHSVALTTDQRGAPRVAGARCDIGAFEFGAVAPVPTANAIEYRHAGFDHYFVTAIADEITKLDNGTFVGWTRTGQAFKVYLAPVPTPGRSVDVCRFFSTAFAPKSSHFYTPDRDECDQVRANPNWQFEAVVFFMQEASLNGNCVFGTQPVYRLYNNGQGAAPNHRYTTSLTVRSQMLAQGWVPEGYGSVGVIMCSPL